MRTLITIIALIVILPVYADVGGGLDDALPPNIPTLRYVVDNDTGLYKTTYVSSSIVNYETDRIIGFEVFPIISDSEAVAALHDTTAAIGLTNTSIFGELEAVEENFAGRVYKYPVKLSYGLCVIQGGQTRVIVYYTRF